MIVSMTKAFANRCIRQVLFPKMQNTENNDELFDFEVTRASQRFAPNVI